MGALPGAAAEQSPRPELVIPRVDRAPTLEDFLDMKPGPAVEGKLAKVDDFRQTRPSDGKPGSERTEAYLGYDDKNLYAIFVAFDSEPQKLRARLVNRENWVNERGAMLDDGVSVSLDTFNDQRRGYIFQANAYGVQWDGLYSDGNGFDVSFDTVWQSRGKITNQGFVIWVAIPFKSLRFSSAPEQTWGILLNRDLPRKSEVVFWPYTPPNMQGFFRPAASMKGLKNISPGRNMQFIPYGALRAFRALDTRDSSAPAFTGKRAEFNAGLDSKFILKDSLVFDLTVNPDFSQVESDEPQITTNERFEVFFPEKRPFFLENASYFQTPINLLFTRRIADPQFGVRLTGKVGRYALGALFADDQSPGRQVVSSDPLRDQRAYFGVVRVSRDLFKSSSVGLIYIDREFSGNLAGRSLSSIPASSRANFNRVGGVDGRLQFSQSWVAEFQAVASSTKFLDGTRIAGPAYVASLSRRGRKFNAGAAYSDYSPGFETLPGFVPRKDTRVLGGEVSYRWWPERRIHSWGPNFAVERVWDHSGTRLNLFALSELTFTFAAQSSFSLFYASENELFRPRDFPGLTSNLDFHRTTRGFSFSTNLLKQASLSGEFRFGQRVNIDPPAGQPPELVNRTSGNVTLTLRPIYRLRIDNNYLLFRLTDRSNHLSVFNNHIIRSRWNWQFNRELSLRIILQYDALLANQLNTSLEKRRNFNTDFLVTYLLHPGTALYAGYNSNLQNIDLVPCVLPATCSTQTVRTNRFINDARGFFVKFSYLFRF